MLKALTTLAFGAIALVLANFATAAPAAASNVGVYAGSNGFAIQVNHYDRYGYGQRRNACSNYWYRRNHPYRCGYGNAYPYSGYNNNYYYGHRYRSDYRWRNHRNHWRDRDRRDDRRHRRHRDRW